MKQPVSRSTFDARNGYLGVYLQEGAPFVDAVWNEGVDTTARHLEDAIRCSGLEGTTDTTLRIDAEVDGEGVLINLMIRGGSDPFYCDGLPLVWLEDRRIDAQSCCPTTSGTGVVDCVNVDGCCGDPGVGELMQGGVYTVYVEATMDAIDETDVPALKDGGLMAPRGSFRTRLPPVVRIATGNEVPALIQANLALTLEGDYAGNQNLFYRVEPTRLYQDSGAWYCGVLWDDAGASVSTRVTTCADIGTTRVEVASSRDIEPGHYLRFEGACVDASIYEVVDIDDQTIELKLVASAEARSLAGVTVQYLSSDEAAGTIEIQSPVALKVDELVQDLESAVAIPGAGDVWRVLEVAQSDSDWICTLKPAGLAATLDPWPASQQVHLLEDVDSGATCIVVEQADCWKEGQQVLVAANATADPEESQGCNESGTTCWPGGDTVRGPEPRVITKIVRRGQSIVSTDGQSYPSMTLRLDKALRYAHVAITDSVTLEHPIKARRHAGHLREVPLRAVDPEAEGESGACCLKESFSLPEGPRVVLSYPLTSTPTTPLAGEGGAWQFAARAGYGCDVRVLAPLEGVRKVRAALARLESANGKFVLYDLRPVPSSAGHETALASMEAAAKEIERCFSGSFESYAGSAAELAALPRVQASHDWNGDQTTDQQGLFEVLQVLSNQPPPALYADWQLLVQALAGLKAATGPVYKLQSWSIVELTRVVRALDRLALVAAMCKDGCCPPAKKPTGPHTEEKRPARTSTRDSGGHRKAAEASEDGDVEDEALRVFGDLLTQARETTVSKSADDAAIVGTGEAGLPGAAPTASGDLPAASGDLPAASGDLSPASDDLQAASGDLSPASGDLSPASGDVQAASGDFSPASGDVQAASGDLQTASGDLQTASGDLQTASGDVQAASGDLQTGSGDLQTGSGDVQAASGDLQTASGDLQTGSGDLQTASGDLQTDSGDLQTDSGDPGYARPDTAEVSAPPASERLRTFPLDLENIPTHLLSALSATGGDSDRKTLEQFPTLGKLLAAKSLQQQLLRAAQAQARALEQELKRLRQRARKGEARKQLEAGLETLWKHSFSEHAEVPDLDAVLAPRSSQGGRS